MAADSGKWLNPVPVQRFGILMQEVLNLGMLEGEVRLIVE